MDYYAIPPEDFGKYRKWPFHFVKDTNELNERAARIMVDLIKRNNEAGKPTSFILPTGPLDFRPWAALCNKESVSLSNVTVYLMDEYIDDDDQPIPESHPLSFRASFRRSFVSRLEPQRGFTFDQVKTPTPCNAQAISDEILGMGGADLCFCGIGISGHLAFNDPPEPGDDSRDLDWMRNCTTRTVVCSRETQTQMAILGTHGNWAIIPRRAVTLGIKELLASKTCHMTFMRSWHSGMMRRACFGPISVDCPASLIQEHPNVEVTCTAAAAALPVINVTLDTDD